MNWYKRAKLVVPPGTDADQVIALWNLFAQNRMEEAQEMIRSNPALQNSAIDQATLEKLRNKRKPDSEIGHLGTTRARPQVRVPSSNTSGFSGAPSQTFVNGL